MDKPKGVGVHVFAGGFTMGVREALPVVGQLEIHNFGRETAESAGIEFMNSDNRHGWNDYKSKWKDCSFCYGNPRCNAFSSFSSGCDATMRGSKATSTRDIWDLCEFGLENKLDVIAFESVQQCYSVGGALIRTLKEMFVEHGYRVIHMFINTATFGNSQKRRRYFFVAHKKNRNFNITVPSKLPKQTTVGDVLTRLNKHKVTPLPIVGFRKGEYTPDSYLDLKEKAIIPFMGEWETYYTLAKNRLHILKEHSPKLYNTWINRTSNLPFSLHSPKRLAWDKYCPVIYSNSHINIHPREDRCFSVREIAGFMGWPEGIIPIGKNPAALIGKGIVPVVGKWLAEQFELCINDEWGDEDFESSYNRKLGQFEGFQHTEKPDEKTFNISGYAPQ